MKRDFKIGVMGKTALRTSEFLIGQQMRPAKKYLEKLDDHIDFFKNNVQGINNADDIFKFVINAPKFKREKLKVWSDLINE